MTSELVKRMIAAGETAAIEKTAYQKEIDALIDDFCLSDAGDRTIMENRFRNLAAQATPGTWNEAEEIHKARGLALELKMSGLSDYAAKAFATKLEYLLAQHATDGKIDVKAVSILGDGLLKHVFQSGSAVMYLNLHGVKTVDELKVHINQSVE